MYHCLGVHIPILWTGAAESTVATVSLPLLEVSFPFFDITHLHKIAVQDQGGLDKVHVQTLGI